MKLKTIVLFLALLAAGVLAGLLCGEYENHLRQQVLSADDIAAIKSMY